MLLYYSGLFFLAVDHYYPGIILSGYMWTAIKQIFARYLLCARHSTDTRYTTVSTIDMDLIMHFDNCWVEYDSFLNYNLLIRITLQLICYKD